MKRQKLHNPFYPKPKAAMNSKPQTKATFTPPPVQTFEPGSPDAEIWLDFATSALKGFASACWTGNDGKLNMVSQGVASKAAYEAADQMLAEYRLRCKKS